MDTSVDQTILRETGVFDLCRELPASINAHCRTDGQTRYRAKNLDCSFNGAPTFAVEVFGRCDRIATYKSNIALVASGTNPWLVFSPLVVVWDRSTDERNRGQGRPIIEHCISSIAEFHKTHLHEVFNMLVASGNLTVEKKGRSFFEALGWEIVGPDGYRPKSGEDGLPRVIAYVTSQIDTAVARFQPSASPSQRLISFAMLRLLSRSRFGNPAAECADNKRFQGC